MDEGKIAELRDDLLLVSPSQFPVVRDALLPYKDSVVEPLWNVALDTKREHSAAVSSSLCLGDLHT